MGCIFCKNRKKNNKENLEVSQSDECTNSESSLKLMTLCNLKVYEHNIELSKTHEHFHEPIIYVDPNNDRKMERKKEIQETHENIKKIFYQEYVKQNSPQFTIKRIKQTRCNNIQND